MSPCSLFVSLPPAQLRADPCLGHLQNDCIHRHLPARGAPLLFCPSPSLSSRCPLRGLCSLRVAAPAAPLCSCGAVCCQRRLASRRRTLECMPLSHASCRPACTQVVRSRMHIAGTGAFTGLARTCRQVRLGAGGAGAWRAASGAMLHLRPAGPSFPPAALLRLPRPGSLVAAQPCLQPTACWPAAGRVAAHPPLPSSSPTPSPGRHTDPSGGRHPWLLPRLHDQPAAHHARRRRHLHLV